MNNLPFRPSINKIFKEWLKSGIIYKENYSDTTSGTPQGGIISPILANFTLNGLEKIIINSILPLTKSKTQRTSIPNKKGSLRKYKLVNFLVSYVRYADDFIILARSKHIIINYIKPAVEEFLENKGD